MPDYSKGKIYTIRCRSNPEYIYVGSTIQPLSKRWGEHKIQSKKDENRLIYSTINNDWTDWYIELFLEYPCENKEQLLRREGEIIREISTLNVKIAGRTRQEYCQENANKIKEHSKEYRKNNADIIKERMKEYYLNNADKRQEYLQANADKLKEQRKQYRQINADKIKEYMKDYNKEYSKANAEKKKETGKEYRKNNAEKHNEYMREYRQKKKLEKQQNTIP